MNSVRHACWAVCSTLMLANAAHAAADIGTATAQLANLRYTLVDLDPNDGIAPGLTINSAGLIGGVGDVGVRGPDPLWLSLPVSVPGTSGVFAPYAPFSYDSATGNADSGFGFIQKADASAGRLNVAGDTLQTTASINPGTSTAVTEMTQFGSSNQYLSSYDYVYAARGVVLARDDSYYSPLGGGLVGLTLTPNTRLIIEGDAATSATGNVSHLAGALADARQRRQGYNLDYPAYDSIDAEASGNVSLALFDEAGYFLWSDVLNSYLYTREAGVIDGATGLVLPEQGVSDRRTLSLEYNNLGSDAITLGLNIKVDANAVERLSSSARITLPEPGTWATMGLGLLGLAAVVRRKRQAA